MTMYRKKPIVVEVWKFSRELISERPEWVIYDELKIVGKPDSFTGDVALLLLNTTEGHIWATEGDYIIKGVKGEVYPCKPDIFEQTYVKVEGQSGN